MRNLLWVFTLFAMAVSAFAPAEPGGSVVASDAETDAFLADMAKGLLGVRTMVTTFTQERRLAVFEDTLRATGVCAFERPDRLRWEMREPYRSMMIYDGRDAARFEWSGGGWRRTESGAEAAMAEVLGRISNWMRGDFSGVRDVYDFRLLRGDPMRIEMTPRSEKMREMIRAIVLHVALDTWRVTRVAIGEPGGDETSIDFASPTINLSLPASAFDPGAPLAVLPTAGPRSMP